MSRTSSLITLNWIILFLIMKYALQFIPGIGANTLLIFVHGSATSLGLIAAAFFYAYLLFQIPAGLIIDRYALVTVLTIALIFCVLGSALFFSQCIGLLVLGRVLMGIGTAFATVGYMRCAALYFNSNWFARLSGFFGTACMGGAGFSMLFFGWIYHGFNFHVMIFTINLTLLSMILFGGILILLYQHKNDKLASHSQTKYQDTLPTTLSMNLKKILCQRNTWLLIIYNGTAFSPISVFGGLWGSNYLHTIYHLSENASHLSISVMFYSFALGGPILCWHAKTLKRQKITMIYGIIIALLTFILLITGNTILPSRYIWVLMAIIGFFSSSFLISYAIVPLLYTPILIATVVAVINMGDPIFCGLAEPLMGKLLDFFHFNGNAIQTLYAYRMSMLVLILYWLIACIAALFIGTQRVHNPKNRSWLSPLLRFF